MGFEEALREIGGFGLFNKTVLIALIVLGTWHTTIAYYSHLFVLITPSGQWCFANGTQAEDFDVAAWSHDKCQVVTGVVDGNATIFADNQAMCSSRWSYDRDEVFTTLTMEVRQSRGYTSRSCGSKNDWVCGGSWRLYSVHTAFWVGSMVGYLISGLLADRIGRKRTTAIFVLLSSAANLAGVFLTGHISFALLRSLAGAGCYTVCSTVFVLVMEYTVSEKRSLVTFVWTCSWAAFAAAFPWFAYYAQSWKWLLASNALLDLLLLLALWWAPESSSWLISAGRSEQGLDILERIARFNEKEVTRDCISEALKTDSAGSPATSSPEKKRDGFWETTWALVATPRIRKITIVMYLTWLIVCLCYNVNNMELGRLGLNVYSTYSIAMALELPVNIFCLLSVDRVGRRWPNVAFMVLGGAVGITTWIVRTDSKFWTLIMAVVCMMAWAGGYIITYQLASEVFPTVIRGRGVLLQRVMGDIGSCLGTQVAALAEYDRLLPALVMGSLSILGAGLMLFIPETMNLALPQTIEDGENFGKDQGICFCPALASKSTRKQSVAAASGGTINRSFHDETEMEEKNAS